MGYPLPTTFSFPYLNQIVDDNKGKLTGGKFKELRNFVGGLETKVDADGVETTAWNNTNATDLRYPNELVADMDTDYIKFDFFAYRAPFNRKGSGLNRGNNYFGNQSDSTIKADEEGVLEVFRDVKDIQGGGDDFNGYNMLNTMGGNNDVDGNFGPRSASFGKTIFMYMPQDVSTSYASQWGGKEFSNMTAGVLSGLKMPVNALVEGTRSLPEGATGLAADTVKALLNVAGQNIQMNDVLAGTTNGITNPNVELMFGGPQLRNIGFKWKMSARDDKEAEMIHKICTVFKMQSLAEFHGEKDDEKQVTNMTYGSNFIKIPDLVRMKLMTGNRENSYLSQYKALALTNVDINYTPDGSYTTYQGGYPTSVELSIKMVETKIVYKDDIKRPNNQNWSY